MKSLCVYSVLFIGIVSCGILDPRHAKRRELLSLDGLWKFSLINSSTLEEYQLDVGDQDVELMAVPSSYNDISTNPLVRDYAGLLRYRRNFMVPSTWQSNRIWLRFGSVCYSGEVYINGELATSHDIGHLPFVVELTNLVKIGEENEIIVIVSNILTDTTIPQGTTRTTTSGRLKQDYTFDFFNYAGIDRPVLLYTTANTYVNDITLHSTVDENRTANVTYDVVVEGSSRFTAVILLVDKDGNTVVGNEGQSLSGSLQVTNANLWWPYLMDPNPGYLYTFKVDLYDTDNNLLDRYELPFGIRELSWDSTSFKINGKPVYITGFGRHEDSDIKGKGLDLPLVLRDYNLIKWIGANCYRTSHYPYAEEIMDLADSLGIMIIDEVPAVNIHGFSNELLENHKRSITELVKRDKNRPSVVIWSAANEPKSGDNGAGEYFKHVIAHVKAFDNTRPVTIANLVGPDSDQSGQYLDILGYNEYSAWYSHEGELDVIIPDVLKTAERWHSKHNKPVLVTEYGADTLEGFHILPNFVWSEEYQTDLMGQNFQAFDELRAKGWFIGEMIWNFADFKTKQEFRRLGGNKKGVFTRQRQPKQSAHLMRKRYWALASLLNNVTLPSDLDTYVIADALKMKDEF